MFERDYVNDELILGKVSFQPHRDPRLEYYGGLDDWLEESGQGTMKFKNGDIYEGGFERSVMHGVGKFTFSDADILGRLHFQGCWDKGLVKGTGTLTYKCGKRVSRENWEWDCDLLQGLHSD